jgi:hypothetical protein
VALIPRAGDLNEITVVDDAVRRIEFYPSGAEKIDFAPRMSGPATKMDFQRISWNLDLPRDKTRGQT